MTSFRASESPERTVVLGLLIAATARRSVVLQQQVPSFCRGKLDRGHFALACSPLHEPSTVVDNTHSVLQS